VRHVLCCVRLALWCASCVMLRETGLRCAWCVMLRETGLRCASCVMLRETGPMVCVVCYVA